MTESAAESILRRVRACNECGLGSPQVNEVPGFGPVPAPLMFVGEAPTEAEEAAGKPFVGLAGKFLTKVLRKMGVPRDRVYTTYILKHRPPENRTPQPGEMSTCMKYLEEEIKVVRPKVICTLGGIATRSLLQSEARFHDLRGVFWRRRGQRVFPTFHPAYILRNPESRTLFEADLRAACVAAGLIAQ